MSWVPVQFLLLIIFLLCALFYLNLWITQDKSFLSRRVNDLFITDLRIVGVDSRIKIFPSPVELASRHQVLTTSFSRSEKAYQAYVAKRRALLGSKKGLLSYWDYFIPSFSCPYTVQRIGSLGDGGKWICGIDLYEKEADELQLPTVLKPCVLYSFGVGGKSTFETEIWKRTNCEVFLYDASIVKTNFTDKIPRTHFNKLYISSDPKKGETLLDVMEQNNHTFIDFLKIDISEEIPVLEEILNSFGLEDLPFGHLNVQFHANEIDKNFSRIYHLWEALEDKGLRPFKSEQTPCPKNQTKSSVEFAFINTYSESSRLYP